MAAGATAKPAAARGESGGPNFVSRVVAPVLAAGLLVGALLYVLGPMLADFSTYGFHDWDSELAYRYITVLSLKHGEGPWWHPFLCGGVPGFGYSEGATNFVSPYLPAYLWFDLRTALRLEVLGQGLLALAGTYAFAGRFTSSVALKSLLAALFVFNGRWALQAATGHTWHLQYAFMPWAFYCFERSITPAGWLAPRGLGWAFGAGAVLAVCCFFGGIYPLPHTALLLTLYAVLRATLQRSLAPLESIAVVAVSAIGLAAPKLFAVVDQMSVIPRLIDSTEVIDPGQLYAMLTAPHQRYGHLTVPVPAYNWHEWGIYVGFGGVAVLVLGLVFGRGARAESYKLLGLLCFTLGLGAFHPLAPWTLLHRLPLFSSQHVPSRFHYPMLLMLGAAFVLAVAPWLDPRVARRPWLDVALLAVVAALAWDMARFSRTPFEQAFWMRAPETVPRLARFEQHEEPPVQYIVRDWAPPMLLAMFANTGVVHCYGVDPRFKPGAVPAESPRYHGLAYVRDVGGRGRATVEEWTPNHAVVAVTDAEPGALVVYDMNYDASWRANGRPALDWNGLVAARLEPGSERVDFRYFPRTFAWSLPLALLTLAAGVSGGALLRLCRAVAERTRRIFDRKATRRP